MGEVGSRKRDNGSRKAKVVQIGNPVKGVNFVKDKENIVFMVGEGWRMIQLFLVLTEKQIGSMLKQCSKHIERSLKHVIRFLREVYKNWGRVGRVISIRCKVAQGRS